MKLYNPFKPHVVELNQGGFAVRKLSLIYGWQFRSKWDLADDEKTFWWTLSRHVHEHAKLSTVGEAIELLNKPYTIKATMTTDAKRVEY